LGAAPVECPVSGISNFTAEVIAHIGVCSKKKPVVGPAKPVDKIKRYLKSMDSVFTGLKIRNRIPIKNILKAWLEINIIRKANAYNDTKIPSDFRLCPGTPV
jgi:hypothetical protein